MSNFLSILFLTKLYDPNRSFFENLVMSVVAVAMLSLIWFIRDKLKGKK